MKIRNSTFLIGWNFGSIDQNGKKIILEPLDELIAIRFLFDRSKRALSRSKVTFDWSKVIKQDFLQNFLVTVLNVWRGIKFYEWFYETFLLSHTCLLMKYNTMSINIGLCGHSSKLLFVESNILVVSLGEICDNPLATIIWGQILFKENDIVPQSYLFSVCLLY